MPLLDMSDILTDIDFIDRLSCLRQLQTIGDDGLTVLTPTVIPFYATVTSISGQDLRRNAEGQLISQSIKIVGRFVLIPSKLVDGVQYTADIVTWNCNQYTITDVGDYSRYGQGFTVATGELLPLSV